MTRRHLYLILLTASAFIEPAGAALQEEFAVLKSRLDQQQVTIDSQAQQLAALQSQLAMLKSALAMGKNSAVATPAGNRPSVGDPSSGQEPKAVSEGVDAVRQQLSTGKESQLAKDRTTLSESLDIYGSFRVFTSTGDGDTNLRSGASRVGLKFGREATPSLEYFGKAEWRINLVDSESEFSANQNPSGGITLLQRSERDALETRLGFVGARFGDDWSISAGKQWSVYYDVSGWTDNFNVFGGAGLSTFNAGTDGGASGTGRADQAIVFRSERGPLDYSLQAQLQTNADGSNYDGFGGSLRWQVNDNFDLGFAFVESRIEGVFEELTGTDESNSYVLGARYHAGPWYAAAAVADWKNHEAVFLDDDTIIYDGRGAEVYVSFEYSDAIHLYGGLNYTDPDVDDLRVDSDFGRLDFILGAARYTTKDSFSYLELLLSDGTEADGSSQDTVLSFGFRYDF